MVTFLPLTLSGVDYYVESETDTHSQASSAPSDVTHGLASVPLDPLSTHSSDTHSNAAHDSMTSYPNDIDVASTVIDHASIASVSDDDESESVLASEPPSDPEFDSVGAYESKPQSDSEVEPESDSELELELDSDPNLDLDLESSLELESETDYDRDSESESEIELESEHEMELDADYEFEPEVALESDSDSALTLQSDSDAESYVASESTSDAESEKASSLSS